MSGLAIFIAIVAIVACIVGALVVNANAAQDTFNRIK